MGLFNAPSSSGYGFTTPITQINVYPEWGATVALALYFTELGGMTAAILSLMYISGKYSRITRPGSIAMFIATVLALGFFTADLGQPGRALFSPFNALPQITHSWMARGIEFVGGLLLFSFLFMVGSFIKAIPKLVMKILAALNVIFGIAATTYSGFELAAATGVAFWYGNGAVPLLYLASGILAGTALLFLIAFFMRSEEGGMARSLLGKLLAYSAIAELAAWFIFVENVNPTLPFDALGLSYLLSSSTFYIDIAFDFLIVLGAGGGALMTRGSPRMMGSWNYILFVLAILALLAAYFARIDILYAGQFAYAAAPQAPFNQNSSLVTPGFGWRG